MKQRRFKLNDAKGQINAKAIYTYYDGNEHPSQLLTLAMSRLMDSFVDFVFILMVFFQFLDWCVGN